MSCWQCAGLLLSLLCQGPHGPTCQPHSGAPLVKYDQQGNGCHCLAILPGVTRDRVTKPAASAALTPAREKLSYLAPQRAALLSVAGFAHVRLPTGAEAASLLNGVLQTATPGVLHYSEACPAGKPTSSHSALQLCRPPGAPGSLPRCCWPSRNPSRFPAPCQRTMQ